MRPVLFEIFGIPVFSYGFLLAVTIIIGTIVLIRRAEDIGVKADDLMNFVIFAVILGTISSRLFYILTNLELYRDNPLSVFAIQEGGLSVHGAIVGGALVAIWFSKRHALNFGIIPDILAPVLALGVGLVRIGCLLNGCCYGIVTDVPWGVFTRYAPGLRHPTQVYESIGGFLLFLFLWSKRGEKRWPGYHFWTFVVGYSLIRFVVEFWRESKQAFLGLTVAQVASLLLVFVGLVVIKAMNCRYSKKEAL